MSLLQFTLADYLLEAGAGASVNAVLGDLPGQRANQLRRKAASRQIRPGVYALVTARDEVGLAVPLRPSIGACRAADPNLRRVLERALRLAQLWLNEPTLPALRLEFEDWLAISGDSIGLPATLAFIEFYRRDRADRVILATGTIFEDGSVGDVDQLDLKIAAGLLEKGDRHVLLTPNENQGGVRHIDTAVRSAFGDQTPEIDSSMMSHAGIIERARREPDAEAAITILDAVDTTQLQESDRAQWLLELGTAHRHAGHSDRAHALHEQARELLTRSRRFVGAEAAERFELERLLTDLDRFDVEETIKRGHARASLPFLSPENEIRCRGMLAQALGMSARYSEAVAARGENLAVHAASKALGETLPGTLCYLALDAARAQDAMLFGRHAARLIEASTRCSSHQWRYNDAALLRALVALGQHERAVAWLSGTADLFGRIRPAATDLLDGSARICTHPETSAARALLRALRRLGRTADAKRLGARIYADPAPGDDTDLTVWLCELAQLEIALLHFDLGNHGEAEQRLAEARAALRRSHAAASRFHAGLLTAGLGPELEAQIDRVWY